jgi:hypothetical protein
MLIVIKCDSVSDEMSKWNTHYDWLSMHISPASYEIRSMSVVDASEAEHTLWKELAAKYVEMTSDLEEKMVIVFAEGAGWQMASVSPADFLDPHLMRIRIEDDAQAVQFKLACL